MLFAVIKLSPSPASSLPPLPPPAGTELSSFPEDNTGLWEESWCGQRLVLRQQELVGGVSGCNLEDRC